MSDLPLRYDPDTDTYSVRVTREIAQQLTDWSEPVQLRFVIGDDGEPTIVMRRYQPALEELAR